MAPVLLWRASDWPGVPPPAPESRPGVLAMGGEEVVRGNGFGEMKAVPAGDGLRFCGGKSWTGRKTGKPA